MPRLESSIKEHLSPALRSDGFFGSGRTFRRLSGDFIHVVNVQGSRHGGMFAINLGIQPRCIPDMLGNSPDATKIREELCEFRRRLSETTSDQWWEHEASKESMDAAVRAAASVYMTAGRRLFSELSGPESPLNKVTPAQFEAGHFSFSGFRISKVRTARSLALMRQSVGNLADASAFARIALANLKVAHAFRAELEALCRATESKQPFGQADSDTPS